MTVAVLLNSIFAFGVVVALAVVCRIPYRRLAAERFEESAAAATLPRRRDRERRAA
jgi:hypothetical protein